MLAGSACPHYDGEERRRPTYRRAVAEQRLPSGYAADDGCGLLFRDGDLVDVVSLRPGAAGYRVRHVDGTAVEEQLRARYLGAPA